jgi:MtN3 and saliva related transmembrane protein
MKFFGHHFHPVGEQVAPLCRAALRSDSARPLGDKARKRRAKQRHTTITAIAQQTMRLAHRQMEVIHPLADAVAAQTIPTEPGVLISERERGMFEPQQHTLPARIAFDHREQSDRTFRRLKQLGEPFQAPPAQRPFRIFGSVNACLAGKLLNGATFHMSPAFPRSTTAGASPGSAQDAEQRRVSAVGATSSGKGKTMDLTAIIGAAAAVFSTASFAPQAWQIIKTRDTSAISAKMYLLTVAAFLLWTSYGWLRRDWALILPNAICLLLASFILVMKRLPQRRKEAVADSLDPDQ